MLLKVQGGRRSPLRIEQSQDKGGVTKAAGGRTGSMAEILLGRALAMVMT